jgi:hypothetical protein
MRTERFGRLLTMSALLLVGATIAETASASTIPPKPRVITSGATHVLTTSALLNAVVNPDGTATSYFFQYGPTTAYGLHTPTVSVGSGSTKLKVGQPVAGLQQGVVYHYRAVAVYNVNQTVLGRDLSFTPKQTPLAFEIAKNLQEVAGLPFILTGSLTGFGSAHHQVVLQASPHPYLSAFTSIGLPGITDAFGRFAFRVANLSTSTEFRVVTVDLRPVYSPVMTVHAAVRVTLRVRSSGHPGFVRLFGTVTPAVSHAVVQFQVQKVVRARGSEESETTRRYVNQFTTVVKKGNASFSRFSLVVTVRHSGRYRASVKLPAGGPLVSGVSSQTVVLHAAPGKPKRKKG